MSYKPRWIKYNTLVCIAERRNAYMILVANLNRKDCVTSSLVNGSTVFKYDSKNMLRGCEMDQTGSA
jgi:hypothetical protein